MLCRISTEIRVDGLVPELLNTVPVLDLSTLQKVAQIVTLSLLLGLISNVKVELWVVKVVSRVYSSLLYKKKTYLFRYKCVLLKPANLASRSAS